MILRTAAWTAVALIVLDWAAPAARDDTNSGRRGPVGGVWGMTVERRWELRDETAALFKHGFDGYMQYAYPADELRPLTCAPLHRDPDTSNVGINDIHANASLTLLDTLSSLPALYPSAFPSALWRTATEVSFDQDAKVQVFEMTIRVLGSLLATYQYLDRLPADWAGQAVALRMGEEELRSELRVMGWGRRDWGLMPEGVGAGAGDVGLRAAKGRVLDLALDMGRRLLPAFDTPTGLPYARVNLRYGVDKGESVETCTAGAGSLTLEFAVLSRLTGDGRFEALASRAYLALWNRRSHHNLLGNTIAVTHGHWLAPGISTVGAGMDSYFEYGIKGAILLDDDNYLEIFQDTYAAIQTHIRMSDGFIVRYLIPLADCRTLRRPSIPCGACADRQYRPLQFRHLQPPTPSTIDSLAAFLPGAQVLAGDIESAIKAHLVHWNVWRRYSAIPESWNWKKREVEWGGWPGRPEFIEATYYLYQATKDEFYLRVGERVLDDIKTRTRTDCGFATMSNVETGQLDDRMESFMLSETLKYLYLLFDPTPPGRLTNQIFTTEGHALRLPINHKPTSTLRRAMHARENLFCPTYTPPTLGGLTVGIERREDYEYARSLVFGFGVDGRAIEDKDRVQWSEQGFCKVPQVPTYSFDIILAPLNATDEAAPEDPAPSSDKVQRGIGVFYIHNITGVRLNVRWRLDNKGYDIASIGPHRVRSGQHVIVTDPQMEGFLPMPPPSTPAASQPSEVLLRLSTLSAQDGRTVFLHGLGATAVFGKDFFTAGASSSGGLSIGGPPAILTRPKVNRHGCDAFVSSDLDGQSASRSTIVVSRGGCTFFRKAVNALGAGVSGMIIIGSPPPPPALNVQVGSEDIPGIGAPDSDTGGEMTGEEELGGSGGETGLIRPSAEEESDQDLAQFSAGEGFGIVYIDWIVGKAVLAAMDRGEVVGVEMIDVRNDEGGSPDSAPRYEDASGRGQAQAQGGQDGVTESGSRSGSGSGRRKAGWKREGRVMVAGWDVWNLRIVEKPP